MTEKLLMMVFMNFQLKMLYWQYMICKRSKTTSFAGLSLQQIKP